MGQISNRFFVNAIADGVTIHGSLRPDKSLVQMWNGSAAVPDWTVPANQPTITLTLLRGQSYQSPSSYKWFYNGNEISDSDARFVKGTTTIGGQSMPTLKIVANLATSDQSDTDQITITGTVESGGAQIDFNAGVEVKIAQKAGSGLTGVIYYPNGADITSASGDGSKVTMVPHLFAESGTEVSPSNFTMAYYLNGSTTPITNTIDNGHSYISGKNLIVTEQDVVDYAVVKCDFIMDGAVVATAFEGVDDTQDEEFMYIQYNGANGKSASLHLGQSVTFDIWVASAKNHLDTAIMSKWNKYEVQLLNSAGEVIQNWTDISQLINEQGHPRNGYWHGVCTITYAQANAAGGNITGNVRASFIDRS